MMIIKCIAIDDEPLALDKIREYIKRISYLKLEKTFDNALSALDYLKSNKTDLIFLDIQMEDLTGVEMLEVMKDKPKVVLTTAYEEFAIKSYELDVSDYLLKPISFQRFLKACEKVCKQLNEKNNHEHENTEAQQKHETKDYFFVKDGYKVQKVNFNDIFYIEGMKDYVKIKTKNGNIMTLLSFKKLEEILPKEIFIRIHKSYMISINKIDIIERNTVIINEKRIPIGKSYQKAFFNKIEKNKLN